MKLQNNWIKPAVMDNTATLGARAILVCHYRNPLSTKKHRTQHDINRGFVGIDKVKMQLRIIENYHFTYQNDKGN
jgi:hypothetical protein